MKSFYIETDKLTLVVRNLRYVYSESDNGEISFIKVVDPITCEDVSRDELMKQTSHDAVLNMATAYLGNYKRTYF